MAKDLTTASELPRPPAGAPVIVAPLKRPDTRPCHPSDVPADPWLEMETRTPDPDADVGDVLWRLRTRADFPSSRAVRPDVAR